ncbi:MAG: transposase [Clostridia bacterium]|nr:transposase [Clostridia bacterium]
MAKSKYETHVAPRLEEVKDWCRNGATDKEIWEKLGISKDSFYEYKKHFSDFSDSLKESKEICDAEVESALHKAALGGNITAIIFWLKNRRPDKWREKPVESKSGENNADSVTVTIEDCSNEDKST